MQRVLIAVMTVFLVLMAACAPESTLQAKPLNLSPVSACAAKCGAAMHCEETACVCNAGLKQCGANCIGASACCTDNDCGKGRTCQNHACVERPVCRYHEEWDDQRKECACAEGMKFCSEQQKCIPTKSCCWHSNCGQDQRCALTTYAGTLCLKDVTKKCTTISEGKTQQFFFPDGVLEAGIQQVLEGGKFTVRVGNETMRGLAVKQSVPLANKTAFVEQLVVFGGNCREEPI